MSIIKGFANRAGLLALALVAVFAVTGTTTFAAGKTAAKTKTATTANKTAKKSMKAATAKKRKTSQKKASQKTSRSSKQKPKR